MPKLSSSWSSRRKPSLTSALKYLTQLWMRLEPPLGPSWSFLAFSWGFSEQKVLQSLEISAPCLYLQPSTRWPSSRYKFIFQVMKRRVTKDKVIQWKLKQRLQDRPPHPVAEARGAGLQPHQLYLQMHFRSSWRGLMDSERSKISILTGWQQFRINSTYFQPSLTESKSSSDLLAIPVKNRENFWEVALEGE